MLLITKRLMLLALFLVAFSLHAQQFDEIKQRAEQGEALGQAQLASWYFLGWQGSTEDHEQAFKWLKKAAEQGLADAQVMLGAMYDRGLGVSGDKGLATGWYEKAADQGHGTAKAILGRNETAQGSVKFSYQNMRLNAARSIPREYAKKFLLQHK